ncbi:Putative aarF domain-containing protein kinase 1 [Durusdinium trenchii]|uniref:AarF domain-containing protein kinase 1 n=1 Tax=Durusdinium trenchii TaxID=1381693 RepID=A0ABP0LCQ0_9DINO
MTPSLRLQFILGLKEPRRGRAWHLGHFAQAAALAAVVCHSLSCRVGSCGFISGNRQLSAVPMAPLVVQGRRIARVTERRASVGEAVDEALRGDSFPPPDWLRLSTIADEEAAQRVGRAVLKISEGLRLEQKPVLRLQHDSSEAALALALWAPPRSMLLVSSMMGEALGDDPQILVENLNLDGEDGEGGEPQFFLGEVTGLALPDLTTLAREFLEKRLVAMVELDEVNTKAALHTTAAGKARVEGYLDGIDAAPILTWAAVGGNSEYLRWIATEVNSEGAAQ